MTSEDVLASISQRYPRFAEHEARGRSPLYRRLARAIAAVPPVLAFLASLPEFKRLFTCGVRSLESVPSGTV